LKIVISSEYREGYQYWAKAKPQVQKRIDRLFDAICAEPFAGLGKPEPLRHNLSGCWSRRITQKERLVYRVEADTIYFLSCRGHYG
jgi:toxin YoeB